jgi:probable HAF family extracellular repeat protein
MKRDRRTLSVELLLLAVALFAGLADFAAAQAPTGAAYTFTQLNVPNSESTSGLGVNDLGQIVGTFFSGKRIGFIYDDSGFQFPSNPFPNPSNWTVFHDINNVGQIVGYIEVFHSGPSDFHGVLIDRSTLTWSFFDYPGAVQTVASGINDRGQIVGTYFDGTQGHGFIRDRDVFSSFDVPFPGAHDTSFTGINNRGQIVGTFVDSTGFNQGFLFEGGVYTDLKFPHPVGIRNGTLVQGINDFGQIVGCIDSGTGVLLDQGMFIPIDGPAFVAGGKCADGINNRGKIVGDIGAGSGGGTGWIATPVVEPATNLNSLVTFTPRPETYRTISETTGCPVDFVGKFTFDALLTNKSTSPALLGLTTVVRTLTNGNLMLDQQTNALAGTGGSAAVLRNGMYSDGLLGPSEGANDSFVVCLKTRQPFTFFVDVFGLKGTITVVPYGSTGFRYAVVGHGQGTGFEKPGFNDAIFSTGNAAFGSSGSCPLVSTVKTNWPINTDLLLRKQFTLDAIPQTLTIGVAIDNDIQVFVNGQDVSGGVRIHEFCAAQDTFIFTVPPSLLKAGSNLLAVRAIDRGTESYVDIQIKATYP